MYGKRGYWWQNWRYVMALSSMTFKNGDPAVEPSRPVLMVEHSSRQQVLPECADRSGDGLPGTITIADVV
jgi:hypothetical protein